MGYARRLVIAVAIIATLGTAFGMTAGRNRASADQAGKVGDRAVMAATGAKWLRFDFDWTGIEPQQGSFNWQPIDRVVDAASTLGIQVLALPSYTPSWVRPAGTTDKTPPTNPADFARFVGAA